MAEIAEMFKQFGPMGLAVILMGAWSVYSARWLREMQDKSAVQHDKVRSEFTVALREQRLEHTASLREVVAEFKLIHGDMGDRIDHLSNRVDNLDDRLRT
jgi:hypothetical protein